MRTNPGHDDIRFALDGQCHRNCSGSRAVYICSVMTVILIMLINHVLVYISHYQEEMNKEIAFYVEIKEGDAVKELVAYLKDGGYKLSSIFPFWLPVSAGSLFIDSPL